MLKTFFFIYIWDAENQPTNHLMTLFENCQHLENPQLRLCDTWQQRHVVISIQHWREKRSCPHSPYFNTTSWRQQVRRNTEAMPYMWKGRESLGCEKTQICSLSSLTAPRSTAGSPSQLNQCLPWSCCQLVKNPKLRQMLLLNFLFMPSKPNEVRLLKCWAPTVILQDNAQRLTDLTML